MGSEKLTSYYRDVVKKTASDTTSHLVFCPLASAYDINPSLEIQRAVGNQKKPSAVLERQLLDEICTSFKNDSERVSLLVSANKTSPFVSFDVIWPVVRMNEFPWFVEKVATNGPDSFISGDRSLIYHRFGDERYLNHKYSQPFFPKRVKIYGQSYIELGVSPELRKVLTRIPLESGGTTINDGAHEVFRLDAQSRRVSMIGHGTYLTACVFADMTEFALYLGLPLSDLEISQAQFSGRETITDAEVITDQMRFPFRNDLSSLGDTLARGHFPHKPEFQRNPDEF